MNKLLKISVMRLSKLGLLVIGACLIACGRDSGPSWQRFALSGFPDFECPVALKEDPRSGKGEDKWSFYYSRDDGTLNVAVSGFFHIPDYDRTEGESSLRYVQRSEVAQVRGQTLENSVTGKVWRLLSGEGEQRHLLLYYVPFDGAQGSSIKSLEMEFSQSRVQEAERIESSWLKGIEMMERERAEGEKMMPKSATP